MLVVHRAQLPWLLLVNVLCLLWLSADSKSFHSFMGPYIFKIRRMEQCPKGMQGQDSITYYFNEVRARHVEEPFYTGNLSIHFFLDDTLGIRIMVGSWSNMGGWKENAHILKLDQFCTSMNRLFPSTWRALLSSVTGEDPACPYYPGVYRTENFTVCGHQVGLKHFLYGRWRTDVQIYETKTGVIKGCVRTFIDTLPV